MKFDIAHLAIGRNIRRPGRGWMPAEALKMVAVEDALADDWEVQLPVAWAGELSAAHLRAVLARVGPIDPDRDIINWQLLCLVLAPLGVHAADLRQLLADIKPAIAKLPVTRHKPVQQRAKAKRR